MARMETVKPAADSIESRILQLRGYRVLLDHDLARLYGVPVKALNQAVKRNSRRFPEDFAFRVQPEELAGIRSQTVTASRRNRRYHPLAFTEHGAIMAANVLRNRKAEAASVLVVRAFVRLRRFLAFRDELAGKLAELERRIDTHDEAIRSLLSTIHELMEPPEGPKDRIGFRQP